MDAMLAMVALEGQPTTCSVSVPIAWVLACFRLMRQRSTALLAPELDCAARIYSVHTRPSFMAARLASTITPDPIAWEAVGK